MIEGHLQAVLAGIIKGILNSTFGRSIDEAASYHRDTRRILYIADFKQNFAILQPVNLERASLTSHPLDV